MATAVIADVCRAIWYGLVDKVLKVPTAEDWKEIADDFLQDYDFPNCVGAVDVKCVPIKAQPTAFDTALPYPNNPRSSSLSAVLLAVADAKCRFRIVDIGGLERQTDSLIFSSSNFGMSLMNGSLDLPQDSMLLDTSTLEPMPHVFVGDEAFPLKKNLMRPFAKSKGTKPLPIGQSVFNNRLARAQSVVERAFKMMTAQWQIYRRVLDVDPETACWIIKATVALHNFNLKTRDESAEDDEEEVVEDLGNSDGTQLIELYRVGSNNAPVEAINFRDQFATFFMSQEGSGHPLGRQDMLEVQLVSDDEEGSSSSPPAPPPAKRMRGTFVDHL